jgi:hypothetical protein
MSLTNVFLRRSSVTVQWLRTLKCDRTKPKFYYAFRLISSRRSVRIKLDKVKVKVKVKVMLRPTVCRHSPSWYQAPTWDPRIIFPIFSSIIFFFTVSGLLMWGALTDEKSGLYFSVFAWHRQCSLSQF